MRDRRDSGSATVECRATICNQRGLHARAAARFVKTAEQFKAEITVVGRGGQAVSGKSIMGLMMLAAGPGTEVELRALGVDAERALGALCDLIKAGFEED